MATYEYTGVTAYVENNEYTQDCLRLLAEVLFPFQNFADMSLPLLPDAEKFAAREDYRYLEDNAGYFCQDDYTFPRNTPVEYQNVNVSEHQIKGHDLLRLYFPVVSERRSDEITKNLVSFLQAVYASSLLSVKTKSALEYDEFAQANVAVVISA